MSTRRDFITLLGGAAAAWPLAARAQQRDRLRRVAVVMQYVETDPQGQLRAAAFREELEKAGWVSGRKFSTEWPNMTAKEAPPADANEWDGVPGKLAHFSAKPHEPLGPSRADRLERPVILGDGEG
jgi:hypothetical protein